MSSTTEPSAATDCSIADLDYVRRKKTRIIRMIGRRVIDRRHDTFLRDEISGAMLRGASLERDHALSTIRRLLESLPTTDPGRGVLHRVYDEVSATAISDTIGR